MHKDIENKIGNLEAQKKQVKLEISELEDALLAREELLNKVDGAIEFAKSIIEVPRDDKKDKKEKKDA
tara:strand:- start:39 stop:242 length:204 start_codon:yes stop_codon:yes gene_type:complete